MDFYCTSAFKATFEAFTKKRKCQLFSCKKDIPEIFTSEKLAMNKWEWSTPIYDKEKFTLYKARAAADSAKKLGKSSGFRVYFALNKETGNIIF